MGDLSFSTTSYGLFIGCLRVVTWRACTLQPCLAFCEEIVWRAFQHVCSFELYLYSCYCSVGCHSVRKRRVVVSSMCIAWHAFTLFHLKLLWRMRPLTLP